MNFSTPIPKGRAMRGPVARAIGVEQMEGVRRVLQDQYDDIVYVLCTPTAWAEIQARAAKHTGVEHTGEVRAEWLARQDLREQQAFLIAHTGSDAEDLMVVCAWCKKVLHEGVQPVSHGICESCSAQVFPARPATEKVFLTTIRQGADGVWVVDVTIDIDGSTFITLPAESQLHALRIERFCLLNVDAITIRLTHGDLSSVQYAAQMGTIAHSHEGHERWMATRPLKVTK